MGISGIQPLIFSSDIYPCSINALNTRCVFKLRRKKMGEEKNMRVGNLSVKGSIINSGNGRTYDRLEISNDSFHISIFGNHISIHPRDRTQVNIFNDALISLQSKVTEFTRKDDEPEYMTFQVIEVNATKKGDKK